MLSYTNTIHELHDLVGLKIVSHDSCTWWTQKVAEGFKACMNKYEKLQFDPSISYNCTMASKPRKLNHFSPFQVLILFGIFKYVFEQIISKF